MQIYEKLSPPPTGGSPDGFGRDYVFLHYAEERMMKIEIYDDRGVLHNSLDFHCPDDAVEKIWDGVIDLLEKHAPEPKKEDKCES